MADVSKTFTLGRELQQAGRLADAEQAFRRVLQDEPDHVDALVHLGAIWRMRGEFDAAEACFRRVIALRPEVVQAHSSLARVLHDQGRYAEAEVAYREAIRLAPRNPAEHFNLGEVLYHLGKLEEACTAYRSALQLNPNHAKTHGYLAAALGDLGQLAEAESEYRKAIQLDPMYVVAYNNLAVVLSDQAFHPAAAAACREGIRLDPSFAPLYSNLARALQQLGEVDDAIAAAEKAVALAQDSTAFCNLGKCYQDQGQLDEAIESYRAGLRINPADWRQHDNLVYVFNYHPRYDPQTVFREHLEWARRHAEPLREDRPYDADRSRERRLRIGYVSGHFRTHAVAAFTEPMLAAHDHSRFEIFCYSNTPDPDETTRRFQTSADHWRDILALPDQAASDVIRQDKVDILVDLAGHISGHRLFIFARKPAPIQVTYLGYQNTTGMSTMDYRLTDGHADPIGTNDEFYTERLVRLPRSFFCYLPDRAAPLPGPLPARERGFLTFGSFNQFSKVTPQVLATWAQVLLSVPKSRLVILTHASPWLEARIAQFFEEHGVDRARVEVARRRPFPDYLRLISTVDIALDSFPFNGHTTTCDCLWQGVPVITLTGRMYASRFGSSAHVDLKLEDLASDSPEAYVACAARLAGDSDRLNGLRESLRMMMLDSPLLDAQGFTRHVEAAYRTMWAQWCASGT